MEAKSILAMVLREFSFEYARQGQEEVQLSITNHPKYGVPMRVRRRGAAA
jgi:cytochrome P450